MRERFDHAYGLKHERVIGRREDIDGRAELLQPLVETAHTKVERLVRLLAADPRRLAGVVAHRHPALA
jgi:hypothetical protein